MPIRLLVIADPGCAASTRYRAGQFEDFLRSKNVYLQTLDWPGKRPASAPVSSQHASQTPPSQDDAMTQLLDCAAQADAVVFQRYLPSARDLAAVRQRARRLTYDFDDAVIYSESTRGTPRLKLRRAWRFRHMLRQCDAVTAGNDYLASLARRYAAENKVHVLPTSVALQKYLHGPDSAPTAVPSTTTGSVPDLGPGPLSGPVLGWIGSRSTLPYLAMLRQPLQRLADEFPQLIVRVIADQLPDLGRTPVELIRWDALTEVRELTRLHVGLAPLPDDAWTRGKCGLRLLQYLAAGVPAVASPVGTQGLITQSGGALSAGSGDEWFQSVRTLLSDQHLARTLSARGRQLVLERFDTQAVAGSLFTIWCAGTGQPRKT